MNHSIIRYEKFGAIVRVSVQISCMNVYLPQRVSWKNYCLLSFSLRLVFNINNFWRKVKVTLLAFPKSKNFYDVLFINLTIEGLYYWPSSYDRSNEVCLTFFVFLSVLFQLEKRTMLNLCFISYPNFYGFLKHKFLTMCLPANTMKKQTSWVEILLPWMEKHDFCWS